MNAVCGLSSVNHAHPPGLFPSDSQKALPDALVEVVCLGFEAVYL